ncbi:MAG TPA: alpha-hydroxy acid oxidase [Terriglobales bacterium]|nr:alpha-hydroxy acid oxidase [Terriglobales bacterium]
MAKLSPPHVMNISDLRRIAERRVPRAVFDYVDGGADGEITLRENCRAFQDIVFRPRQAVAMEKCDLRTRVLGGHEISFPAILAPVGYCRLMHPEGEIAAARAAGEAGTGYILSTISGHKLENVKAGTKGFTWYQLYLAGGRAAAEGALERAQNAGFSALVVTIDTAVAGLRERDPRNGVPQLMGGNPLAMLPFFPQLFARPRWLINFLLDGGVPKLENVVIPGKGPLDMVNVSESLSRGAVSWKEMSWIREAWRGPIIIKGVLIGDDARRAADEGASAVVVSNHGGRQLDSVSATIRALPEVVAAVGDKIEVLMDGGIRRGGDIAKALCLGARAVLFGRAYAYGLAAGGHAGVTRAIQILKSDFERTMRLLGCHSVSELNGSFVTYPQEWRPCSK